MGKGSLKPVICFLNEAVAEAAFLWKIVTLFNRLNDDGGVVDGDEGKAHFSGGKKAVKIRIRDDQIRLKFFKYSAIMGDIFKEFYREAQVAFDHVRRGEFPAGRVSNGLQRGHGHMLPEELERPALSGDMNIALTKSFQLPKNRKITGDISRPNAGYRKEDFCQDCSPEIEFFRQGVCEILF